MAATTNGWNPTDQDNVINNAPNAGPDHPHSKSSGTASESVSRSNDLHPTKKLERRSTMDDIDSLESSYEEEVETAREVKPASAVGGLLHQLEGNVHKQNAPVKDQRVETPKSRTSVTPQGSVLNDSLEDDDEHPPAQEVNPDMVDIEVMMDNEEEVYVEGVCFSVCDCSGSSVKKFQGFPVI